MTGDAGSTHSSLAAYRRRREKLLRSPLGGRLRAYTPRVKRNQKRLSRLEELRKAIVRGELYLNGFNRWRLQEANRGVIGWTFVDSDRIAECARIEVQTALRESGNIRIIEVDEANAKESLAQLRGGGDRPDLIVIRRDWVQFPESHLAIDKLLVSGKERGCVMHIVAAIGNSPNSAEKLHREARQRHSFESNTLVRPLPPTSKIERRFGESLIKAGLNPKPQTAVANYFLDFAVYSKSGGLPLRLDIEVDGRHWHEELPGHRRRSDNRRDLIVQRLGWRPIRFWTDEIEQDELKCIRRIQNELSADKSTEITKKLEEKNGT